MQARRPKEERTTFGLWKKMEESGFVESRMEERRGRRSAERQARITCWDIERGREGEGAGAGEGEELGVGGREENEEEDFSL